MFKNKRLKALKDLVVDTYKSWSKDNASSLGAALAYFAVFSLAPLVIVLIAVVSLFFGPNTARDQIFSQVGNMVGSQGADFIKTAISSTDHPKTNVLASIIGSATLLLGAIGVFSQLRQSLNIIWKAPEEKTKGIIKFIKNKVLSFGMVLAVGFLLIVSLAVSAGLSAAGNRILGGDDAGFILKVLDILLSVGVFTVLFAVMFKFLPNAHVSWKNSFVGGLVTALLFTIGKFAIGLYLGSSTVASTYGAAASLVILLLWVYYSSQIFYFGAEFTRVYSDRNK